MNLFSLFLHQTSVYRNGAKNPHRGHWKKAEERIGVNVASAALSDPAAAAVAAGAAAATSTADAAATASVGVGAAATLITAATPGGRFWRCLISGVPSVVALFRGKPSRIWRVCFC